MQPAIGSAIVRVALGLGTPVTAGGQPLALRVGQELLAEVLSLGAPANGDQPGLDSGAAAGQGRTQTAVLSMAGRRFQAQVPAGVQDGQLLRLAVTGATPERLTLRVVSPIASGAPAPMIDPATILAEFGLPLTPELRLATAAFVERGLPLSRESLLAARTALAGQPGAVAENARLVANLVALGIPPTARSLALARGVMTQSPLVPLGDLLRNMLREAGLDLSDPGDAPAPTGKATSDPGAGPNRAALPGADGHAVPSDPDGVAGGAANPAGSQTGSPASATGQGTPAGRNELRAAILQFAANSPDASELQRVVQLLGETPEAHLAAALQSGQDGGEPGTGGPASGTPSAESPDASTTGAAGPLAGQPAGSGPVAPTAREALSALANLDLPAAPASRDLTGANGLAAQPPPAAGESARPDRPLSTGEAPRPGELAGRAGDEGDPASAGSAAQNAPPEMSDAVRVLVGTLHDRLEFQQLQNAAAAARGARTAAAMQSLMPATPLLPPDVESPATVFRLLAGGIRSPGDGAPLPASPVGVPPLPVPGAGLPDQASLAAMQFSLPLAFGGRFSTLELAVQREAPRQRGSEPGVAGVRAQFAVQLRHLGVVSADLRLAGATLRCRFTVPEGPAAEALSEALGELHQRFQAVGFAVEALSCGEDNPASQAVPDGRSGMGLLRRVDTDA